MTVIGAFSPGGTPGASLDESITPPVLSLAVGATTYPPEFDCALDDTVNVGDTIALEWSDDIRFGSTVGSALNAIDSAEATANAASFTGLSSISSPSIYYYRARVVQFDGDYSNWSNTVIHGEAEDSTPAAFSFTDVNDATLSTQYTSAAVQLTGFNQPVTISVTGGEYATSEDDVTYSAFTSSAGTVYPNDYVKARHTSSASNSTATNTVVTAGGVSDTYTTTTEAAVVSLPSSGLILQLDADDTSTLFTSNAGSGAVSDGSSVGYWGDKSGGGFHLTSAADDTTRPTYRTNAGLPYVEFDGTNDILRRLAALGMYSAGACTVAVAIKTTNATHSTSNLAVIMEGRGSVSNNPVYAPIVTTGGSTAEQTCFFRNDTPTQFPVTSPVTTAMDGSDRVLTLTDNGSSIIGYKDGAAGTTRSYTRSGTLTLDVTGLGGWQRSTASSWLGCRIYAIAVWNRVLNSTERATVLTYMGAKQGRAL